MDVGSWYYSKFSKLYIFHSYNCLQFAYFLIFPIHVRIFSHGPHQWFFDSMKKGFMGLRITLEHG